MRVRHRDDLPVIGGIGEHLLVTGERGVEDHLAEGLTARADAAAAEHRAVLEDEQRVAHRDGSPSFTVKSPRSSVWTTRPRSLRPAKGVLRLRECSTEGSTV